MMGSTRKLRRDAGVVGLLYASLGSIIGSGWLFGALHAAMQAGSLSVLSWIVGALSIILLAFLAFVFAELSTMFPNCGSAVHVAHVSHGDLMGKIWSWIFFLAFVSTPPVEVSAIHLRQQLSARSDPTANRSDDECRHGFGSAAPCGRAGDRVDHDIEIAGLGIAAVNHGPEDARVSTRVVPVSLVHGQPHNQRST
jgi:hypothetical protein